MQITIEVTPGEHATLRAIARDNTLADVESLVKGLVRRELRLNEDRAEERKKSRTCSGCKTLNTPKYTPRGSRARTECEECGKKLTAKSDPFVPGSITAITTAFRVVSERADEYKRKMKQGARTARTAQA
jgi:uncharacterized paraquat-inducible protein A